MTGGNPAPASLPDVRFKLTFHGRQIHAAERSSTDAKKTPAVTPVKLT
jgi:hypothetical protein